MHLATWQRLSALCNRTRPNDSNSRISCRVVYSTRYKKIGQINILAPRLRSNPAWSWAWLKPNRREQIPAEPSPGLQIRFLAVISRSRHRRNQSCRLSDSFMGSSWMSNKNRLLSLSSPLLSRRKIDNRLKLNDFLIAKLFFTPVWIGYGEL